MATSTDNPRLIWGLQATGALRNKLAGLNVAAAAARNSRPREAACHVLFVVGCRVVVSNGEIYEPLTVGLQALRRDTKIKLYSSCHGLAGQVVCPYASDSLVPVHWKFVNLNSARGNNNNKHEWELLYFEMLHTVV
jgi:hypothetical protein